MSKVNWESGTNELAIYYGLAPVNTFVLGCPGTGKFKTPMRPNFPLITKSSHIVTCDFWTGEVIHDPEEDSFDKLIIERNNE